MNLEYSQFHKYNPKSLIKFSKLLIENGFDPDDIDNGHDYEKQLDIFETTMKLVGVTTSTDMEFFAEFIRLNSLDSEEPDINNLVIPEPKIIEVSYSVYESVRRTIYFTTKINSYSESLGEAGLKYEYYDGYWSPWDGSQYDVQDHDSDTNDFEIEKAKDITSEINKMKKEDLDRLKRLIEIKLRSL